MELLQKALFNLPRATGATGAGATAGDISRRKSPFFIILLALNEKC